MTYIRTITGVYKIGRNFKLKVGDNIHIPNEGVVKIINQADTIEELCDELVSYDNGGINKEEIVKEDLAKFLLKQGGRFIIFGAIWTDKGLIYVAKMNLNGDLELL